MKAREIAAAIDDRAPPALAYPGDNIGFNIGDPSTEVTRVVAALTVTEDVFRAARRARAQMIVSHHPAFREPMSALRTDDPLTRLCVNMAAAGIVCYAAHTNLDVVPGGVNDVLADRLALRDRRPLAPVPHAGQVKLTTFVPAEHLAQVREAVCAAGAGVIGEYTHCTFSAPGVGTFRPSEKATPFSGKRLRVNEEPELRFETLVPKARLNQVLDALQAAHPYEQPAYDMVMLENRDPSVGLGVRGRLAKPVSLSDFARGVRRALEVTHVRVVGDLNRKVQTIGVLGGGGGRYISHTPPLVDVLVTGDVGYHDAWTAELRNLALVDAGHAGTEKWIVPVIVRFLKKRFPTLSVVAHVERDVFHSV